MAALIVEEKGRIYMLEAVQEDPVFNKCLDWDPKTHVVVWDIEHDYVQILYGKERSRPPRSYRPPCDPCRDTIKEACDEC